MILHVLLYIGLCLAPALVLIPLRVIDREPRNEIEHHQDDRDGDAEMRAAA